MIKGDPTLDESLPTSSAREPAPGERVGRYRIEERLGAGGMGVVYCAHDPQLDRRVALKLLARSEPDSKRRRRLLREGRAMAKLSHANVLTVHDIGIHGDRVFIAMEYIDGPTAHDWLRRRRRDWREVLDLFLQAGRGLEAAHQARLVHRDFKPGNVLLDGEGRAKVTDFGFARKLPVPASNGTIDDPSTDGSRVVGTPAYMAPEQQLAAEPDARSDQFAFCVSLWEGLYGKRPFDAPAGDALLRQIVDGVISPPPPGGDVPESLRPLLERGLAGDPDARHPSMTALLGALERAAAIALNEQAADHAALDPQEVSGLPERYRVMGRLSGGELGPLYTALDGMSGRLVTIKLPSPLLRRGHSGEQPRGVRHYEHALAELMALRHPNVVPVLGGGLDEERNAYFVLDLAENTRPFIAAARDRPMAEQVRLLVELLRALAYLHRRGAVHGDLRPGTALVSGGRCMLLYCDSALITVQRLGRSWGYAAPELLMGKPATAASDLYATGVLAYELLGGKRPYSGESWQEVTDSVLADIAPLEPLAVDAALASWVAHMLAKHPERRLERADDAIAELVCATGHPLSDETFETRESVLQTVPLVGRSAELELLVTALAQATRGQGRAVLIEGEAGVGKSRLIDELAARAMARGAVVVRGQAVQEAPRPYELWSEALRWVAHQRVLEREPARLLEAIVPPSQPRSGSRFSEPPRLDQRSARSQLAAAIGLAVDACSQPVVLVVEDLQWALPDSLDLLEQLTSELTDRRLLVVGACRTGESANVRERLSGLDALDLERLDRAGLRNFAQATVGQAACSQPLLALLERETEGNPFFAVEVLRSLAEEAGGLDAIGSRELPDSVMAGGIKRLLTRRLKLLAPPHHRLLHTAAIAGRDIDLALLKLAHPDADVDAWLDACVRAAIIERQGQGHRFTHDKLRAAAIEPLSDEARREAHGRVAVALDELRGGPPEHAAELAHHYRQAGDRMAERAMRLRAGTRAITRCSENAVRHLRRAVELDDTLRAAGEGYDAPERAHCLRLLGDALFEHGQLEVSIAPLRRALLLAGRRLPRGRAGWLLLLVVQGTLWLARLLVHARPPAEREGSEWREASRAASRLAQALALTARPLELLATSTLAVNLAWRGGGHDARATGMLAYAVGLVSRRLAARSFAQARAAADEQHAPTAAVLLRASESIYHGGLGQLDRAAACAAEGQVIAERLHYRLGQAQCLGLQAQIARLSGDLERAGQLGQQAAEQAEHLDAGHRGAVTATLAAVLHARGDNDGARRVLDGVSRQQDGDDRVASAMLHAERALSHARAGEHERAARAWHAARHACHPRCLPALTLQVLSSNAETTLRAWRTAEAVGGDAIAPAARAALTALRDLERWAKHHPIGRADAALAAARVSALDGHRARAARGAQRALRLSHELGLHHLEAVAHRALAELLPTAAERKRHAELGREMLAAAGVKAAMEPLVAPIGEQAE